ncbi:MAG: undecaprenyl-diphosphate phosphatase [Clostridiaceae bacterium]
MADINILFLLKALFMGIVEGVTEFLPVSSTGHLIIFGNILNFYEGTSKEYVDMFDMVIQLGAILAVVVLYFGKIKETVINLFPKPIGKVTYEKSGFKFWLTIAISCIPGAAIIIPFDDVVDKYLFYPNPVAAALIIGGILMIVMENKYRKNRRSEFDLSKVTIKQALIIGAFQCLSIIPGMSRSASTIMGGWVAGLSTVAAAEYSFFIAIPVMIGMSFIELIKIGGFAALSANEIVALGVGFLVSFIVALLVVDGFVSFLKKKPLRVFAVYRFIFAIIVIAAGIFGVF